jgi:hypothetical protein
MFLKDTQDLCPEDMMTLKWNLRKLGVIIDNKTLGSLNCLETVG